MTSPSVDPSVVEDLRAQAARDPRVRHDMSRDDLAEIVGDLIESLLKRDAEVKDTGALLPGTGGLLDRIDSPLLGIPVMYYGLLVYVFLRLA